VFLKVPNWKYQLQYSELESWECHKGPHMGNSSLIMRDALARCVVFFGLIGAMLGILSRNTVVDFDMFHSMALFREAIATGWIPSEDMFSYIPTISPVIHHEWGTGALLYLVTVSSGLGATGLMVTKYLLSATVVMGCYLYVKRQGVSVAVFAPLALIAIPIGKRGFTTIRAQLFTLLFLVILLLFLQEDRHRKRWWIAIWLPLYAIWVNLHAGFVVGIGLMALHTLERFLAGVLNGERFSVAFGRVKHLAAIVAVMVFMIVLNPYGLRYIPHLW
jgi:hypothetical protein